MPRSLPHISHISHITANRRKHTRPSRWTLLAIVLAALVCLGTTCDDDVPVQGVGILDDGALIIDLRHGEYVSVDGGYTWQPLYTQEAGERRLAPYIDERWWDAVRWGAREVVTPRGVYVVEIEQVGGVGDLLDVSIARIGGDGKEVVYSPPHLQNSADRRFRGRQHVFNDSSPRDAPTNLVYHTPSGNIVAVLGLEGVVMGDYQDNWRPLLAEVGEEPVDVSMSNRITFAVSQALPATIAIAIATTAAALGFAEWSRNGRTVSDALISMFCAGIGGLLTLAALLAISTVLFLIIEGSFDASFIVQWRLLNAFVAFVALLGAVGVWRKDHRWFKVSSFIAGAAVPMIVFVAILEFTEINDLRENLNLGTILAIFISCVSLAGAIAIWLKTRALIGAMNLMVACICSAALLVAVHNSYGASGYGIDRLASVYLGSFVCGISGVLALICFAPSFVRQLPAALTALAAMIGIVGLIALAFTIDAALGFYVWPAKLSAILLVLAATVGLSRYLRKSLRLSQPNRTVCPSASKPNRPIHHQQAQRRHRRLFDHATLRCGRRPRRQPRHYLPR